MLLPHRRRPLPPSSPPPGASIEARDLRRRLRLARRDIPEFVRCAATVAVHAALRAAPELRRVRRLGAYVAQGGELDLGPYLAALSAEGCAVYLPRLAGTGNRMRFALHAPGMSLARNRFGILEPTRDASTIAPGFLQVVLLPLVGFDAAGTRLGSGAGFYDRCFAFRNERRAWHAPLLVGVGFACQEVDRIARQAWDVPLDAVVTEAGLRRFPGSPH